MNKLVIIFILFSISVLAREEVFPSKVCPAFDNMKHTKNTHGVHLDTQKRYTILRHHKGQNLILVNGAQPSQRWVDDECFSRHSESSASQTVNAVENETIGAEDVLSKLTLNTDLTKHTKKYENINTNEYKNKNISTENILALSWHNAFCETHRHKKECKRSTFFFGEGKYHEKHFVLHGLWPQPKNTVYCDVDAKYVSLDKHKQWSRLPALDLQKDVEEDLQKVMPGFASNLHKHEWIKHGTCYGTDANTYYRDSISLVTQLNDSKVGVFFTKNIGERVTLRQIRLLFDRSFGMGAGKRVELKCNKGLITELWLHLGAGDDTLSMRLKNGKETRSHCQGGLVDRAGF
jgi:ribonuclease T2